MLEPSYRQALGRAFSLVWRHKMLWVLGLLSVFVGEMGLSNFLGELFAKFVSTQDSWWPTSWGAFHITTPLQFFWFIWLAVLMGALVLFVLVAAVCAQAALIYAAQHWYRFHTLPNVAESWHKGAKHFWGILGVNVLEKLLLSVLISVVISAVPLLPAGLAGFIWTILIISVAAFLALLVSLVAIYALGYIVQDNLTVLEAVGRGWYLAHNHLLVSLELTAILLLCNILVAWVISLGSIIVLIPSFVVSIVGGAGGFSALINFAVGLYMVLFAIFVMLLGAFFNAFTTSAWMYLFMKMHHEGLTSRLAHYAGLLFSKKHN